MRGQGSRRLFSFLAARALGVAAVALLCLAPMRSQNASAPVRISVDLQEAARRIFHVRLVLPAKPGPLTLLYPKWIPGEHAPDGPIEQLVGLKFTAEGKTLPWRRDDLDLYAFHLDVPAGADSIEADYDYLSPIEGDGYSAGPTADPVLAVLEWNIVVLYPAGTSGDALSYEATLRLPRGWKFASALPVARRRGEEIDFSPVSLTTLVDSPVLAGEHFRSVALATDVQPPHHLDIAADNEADLDIGADQVAAYSNLVREAGALFGARHYSHYDFLLSLTNNFSPNGLEHHESSDERAPETTLIDADKRQSYNSLLSHEFTHSWNGKYRRPSGLATTDYEQPMKDDLLWVYEGLTQYIGEMIATRSGLRTPEDYREALAWTAASLDQRPGRNWRPLADTAVAAPFLYNVSSRNWEAWRRGVDFYDEGWLIWLDADILIRRETHGQKSLDDFCLRFYGAPSTPPKVVPYTLDDVVAALNQVLPYDWRGFFHTRVDEIQEHAPTGGITRGGWRLVYNATPNQRVHISENVTRTIEASFSLGLRVSMEGAESGNLADVIPGTPAAEAGLAPGMKLVSVNGTPFSQQALTDAVHGAQGNKKAITVVAQNSGFTRTYEIQYHGGDRYPHLERDPAQADLLGDTLRPLTGAGAGK
jgi:predicted metalloprotease with PDZ domain